MRPIKVLVVCATALATSTMATMKLQDEFKKRGIPVQITTGRITDMMPMISQTKPDLVVATAEVRRDVGVPIFGGVPLLSGIGVDALFTDIFACVDTLVKGLK